jgi:hypothetical protein
MRGLDPRIPTIARSARLSGMAGTSPAMTMPKNGNDQKSGLFERGNAPTL